MDIYTFFLYIGTIILIGFAGRIARQKTSIPESLFLILFGLLIGPVLGIIQPSEIFAFFPIVSVAAMIAILIESGVEFDISNLKGSFHKAIIFTFLVAISTTLLIAGFLYFLQGWDFWHAALLGLISSGTTTITTMALLKSLQVKEKIRQILLLETIVNDFTLILGTFMIVEIISLSNLSVQKAAIMVLSEFSVGILIGVIVSYSWKFILAKIHHKKELSYASTLGVCFLLYFFSNFVGANAIISIFTFSLLFGNYHRIYKFVSVPDKNVGSIKSVLHAIRTVQTDMTFFLASSFFVLLGITFDLKIFLQLSPIIIVGILGMVLAARFFSSTIMAFFDKTFSQYRTLIAIMIPRGYVAAVLAYVPAQEGVVIPMISDIVVILIVATTIISIIGTAIYSRIQK